ncbi:NifB/NifX family molybdenum-iron cluster-binding protein [Candidatus Oscillochloris fontis]|uniref:NifB/NifX family molybdenum-iron cluster-binding protein n=1 Tax=Candidatus Oscillochloris fontis TaxID=2496868 RepID=UPI00101C9D2E|nr:NifB/NifX family molybdenum-iron cluster-binding protein [Candidatus Oscillochloris fontis]
MKIALVSDNGTTISRHFGRARQYVVVTVEDGNEVARELRSKEDCHSHGHDHDHDHDHSHSDPRHDAILDAIRDCQVVIAGGMGAGMDQRLRSAGINAIRTQIPSIEIAIEKYLKGQLSDMVELVH